jgi:hypothetical protein
MGPPKDDVYPRDFAHIYGVLDAAAAAAAARRLYCKMYRLLSLALLRLLLS